MAKIARVCIGYDLKLIMPVGKVSTFLDLFLNLEQIRAEYIDNKVYYVYAKNGLTPEVTIIDEDELIYEDALMALQFPEEVM